MADNETLRGLREAAGLSQVELSERLQVAGASISQTRISEYERCERFPGPENVQALAAALGVEPQRLYSILLSQRAAKGGDGAAA